MQSCPTSKLHHMSSNSFVIPRLYKFEITLWSWTIFDMNHCIFSTIKFCSCRSNARNPKKFCQYCATFSLPWRNLGNHRKPSQEQFALLWLTSHNPFVHNNNVGYCKGLIPCLHEQVDIITQMLIYKTI